MIEVIGYVFLWLCMAMVVALIIGALIIGDD